MAAENRIMIQLFHPLIHQSRVNRRLAQAVTGIEGVTVRHMYEIYPDFFIDVGREQDLLLEHDLIVWQHPFYWYSCPSLLKEWIDLVLEHGFAYGSEGRSLEGKRVLTSITTGGRKEAYDPDGRNRYSIRQLLAPFEQTTLLCRMEYLPPFVVHGTHLLNEQDIDQAAEQYHKMILSLRDGLFDRREIASLEYLNDLIT